MLRRVALLIGLVGVLSLAAACGGGDDSSSEQETGTGGQAAATQAAATQQATNIERGGTLRIAMELNPQRFDPKVYTDVYSGDVVNTVFDTLMVNDENLTPQPWLAEKIDRPDDITFVFTLRQGVKFHDGTEMDAEAVKFSMDRIREYPAGPTYADSQWVADTTVLDKYTIKVTLKEPFAPFLSVMAGRLGIVVSPTAVRTMGDEQFALKPVGTGAYKFVEWQNDNFVRVVRNESYWKQGADGKPLPYLDGIEWKIMTEPTSRLTALQAGDVDMIRAGAVRDPDLPIVRSDPNLVYEQKPGFNWGALLLTTTKPPFDNKALRQAVQNALDREEINRAIYEGNAFPAMGPLPTPMEWARDPSFNGYDPSKVKQYLAEGGRPSGFEFTAYFSAGSSQTQQLAELMQSQLAKHGIKMNIEFADFNGVVIPKAKAQEPGAFAIGFSCGPDPDACLFNRFSSTGSVNYMHFNNPQVDELLKAERNTYDEEGRARLFKQVVPLIVEESPAIFTVHTPSRFAGNKKVKGWYLDYHFTRRYAEYWLSE
ncbi:MAG: ABC transporter substrate-binding protein [Dehalococcoidia bacterium]